MNIAAWVAQLFDREYRARVFRATVTGTSGNLVTVQRPGQGSADAQSYPRLASYSSPVNGDEVLVIRLGDGLIVAGKVSR